ncbi:MAG TPA: cysteine desulfurase family protein [Jatrophihabitantaceae bacterium]|jgi:cysteine desulfurase|nr:cysteine desulfurase family protein [Jatrophihabitantaceae bacterium]
MAPYLDHAATTPMLPEAIGAMTAAMAETGNPSSLHAAGRAARRRVEESREKIADALGARPSEVIFTGGGTEADNLAVKGIFWGRRNRDPRRRRVVASAVEHHAVMDAVEWLAEHEGAEVTWLPVDHVGRVSVAAFEAELAAHADEIAVAAVMWANNEVGTVQPIAALSALAAEHGVLLHTDAIQAVGALPVHFAESGVAALSLTGHKLGGPVGVGALLLGRDVPCVPLLHGGGQERDVRSGTLDAAGIVGLATAVSLAVAQREDEALRLAALRDRLRAGILARVPDAVCNGCAGNRLPGNLNVSFPGCEGDSLLMLLDAAGIACSTGSACSSGVASPSHVLLALGIDPEVARASLRFTLGHTSTEADVDAVLDLIAGIVERARRARDPRFLGVLSTTPRNRLRDFAGTPGPMTE